MSAQISHKTEVGGVRLNLNSATEVERAAEALAAAVKAVPGASIDGFLVQEMVEGVEIILGARTDPLYGPMLVVGAGGILVELVQDVAFRLLPVGPDDARALGRELVEQASRLGGSLLVTPSRRTGEENIKLLREAESAGSLNGLTVR